MNREGITEKGLQAWHWWQPVQASSVAELGGQNGGLLEDALWCS